MARTLIDPSLTPAAGQNVQNILINGGMEFWQRGNSIGPSSGNYTADRWKCIFDDTPSFLVTKETSIVDVGGASMKLNITAIGTATQLKLIQGIENYSEYLGKTITFSMRVRSNSSKVRLAISDNVTRTYSSYHTGGDTFETLSVTKTISGSASGIYCEIGFIGEAPVISASYFDSGMLVIGTQVANFVPKNYATELLQCQRYCFKAGGYTAQDNIGTGFAISATEAYINIPYPVLMYSTTPTYTAVNANTFRLWNNAGGSVAVSTAASLGAAYVGPMSATAYVVVAGGLTVGAGTILRASTTGYILIEGEM